MAPVNNFLPFCPTDTGTNLLSQADYAADADRTSGNKPGVASSALNNKAVRQANFVTSQLAQFLADQSGADLLDDAVSARILAQINAVMKPFAPVITNYISGSGNHNLTYLFFIASGSATAGATYTNNAITFTVKSTIAAGVVLKCTGAGAPSVSGTLTKASGTGDATITFYAFRAPLYLVAEMVGGGAGGGGGSGSGGTGSVGNDTTFGVMTAGGGLGGNGNTGNGGAGGSASLGSGPTGLAVPGSHGGGGLNVSVSSTGGAGGVTPFGGGSGSLAAGAAGISPAANSGGGGSGAGSGTTSGGGGGAGGYVKGKIDSPTGQYAYGVGTGGAGGSAGGGAATAAGAAGQIIVEEFYQ